MCNLSKGVREEGIQQGIQQGRKETLVESIANLMRNMKLTCDQAMDALGIPEADKAWYAKKLGKNQLYIGIRKLQKYKLYSMTSYFTMKCPATGKNINFG